MEEQKIGGVSGFTLKMIALVTMFIDHFGAAFLNRALLDPLPFMGENIPWYTIYLVMRCIGRMAFPVYCFLLVEGFHYTHSRFQYALRLFLFALVSDVPFDLAFNYSWFDYTSNNVFWTLLIGLLVIWAVDTIWAKVRAKEEEKNHFGWILLRHVITLLILAVGMGLAEYLLYTDYGAAGVLTIFVMYTLRFNRILSYGIGVTVLTAATFQGSGTMEFLSIFMLIPIAFYHGKRGPKMNKYFFYAFYPVHLLCLVGLCLLCGLEIF